MTLAWISFYGLLKPWRNSTKNRPINQIRIWHAIGGISNELIIKAFYSYRKEMTILNRKPSTLSNGTWRRRSMKEVGVSPGI